MLCLGLGGLLLGLALSLCAIAGRFASGVIEGGNLVGPFTVELFQLILQLVGFALRGVDLLFQALALATQDLDLFVYF